MIRFDFTVSRIIKVSVRPSASAKSPFLGRYCSGYQKTLIQYLLKILRASISKRQYRNTVVIRTEYLLNLQQRFCYSIVTRKCFLFLKRKATFIFWLILFNCFCLYSPIGSRSMSFSIPFLTGFFFYFFFFFQILTSVSKEQPNVTSIATTRMEATFVAVTKDTH